MINYITKKFENELEYLRALYVKYEAVRDKKDKLKAYTKTYQKYSKTEDNYAIKIITLRTNLIEKMKENEKISALDITTKDLENFINAYMDENERKLKEFEVIFESEKQILESLKADKYQCLARDENGTLYAYKNPVYAVKKMGPHWIGIFKKVPYPKLFKFIKWSDVRACRISDLIAADG